MPAERVVAVEQLTGVGRHHLRPDLYDASGDTDKPVHARGIDGLDEARAQEYLLLATLLTRAPSQALLADLGGLKGDASPLGMAHIALAEAARAASATNAGAEFFNVFIGVGRGDVLPYASYYLTGFLNERPLARVRDDFGRLGLERQPSIYETEDHIGSLFEVMAGLIMGRFEGSPDEAARFFGRHIRPWGQRFFADLEVAPSARFYKAVAGLGQLWLEIETEAWSLPE